MADKPHNIETIFHEAGQIADLAERAAFLSKSCGVNKAMRARIEKLLSAEPVMGEFLQDETQELPGSRSAGSPVGVPTTSASLSEMPGAVIGRYKLLQQIGEGGFGVVYMAEQQEPVRRRVALKIIKLGMDTKQVIARFEAERQALAMMDHPNIAKVFDAGATDTGRPYFVMELVKGMPITEYCDKKSMSLRDRLHLFVQVCDAVQHAHQKGIIHRDIKPSNVLVTHVDDKPVAKVIDFGIAKATEQRLTEQTMFTEFGQFIGTPAYMSPEQADPIGIDIDTRSDIYSLGVLLYELLTGVTPFDIKTLRGAALDEIKRMIREDEPNRPSTRLSNLGVELDTVARQRSIEPKKLGTILRGDLDWIIMKALEKDRTHRYETASGFAADIDRYLNDEPVVAGPPSPTYRLRKFVRRNRAAVLAGSGIALALVAGMIGTSWGLIWALDEKDRADVAARAEVIAREAAQEQAQRAEAVNEFLTYDLLGAVDPTRTQDRDITMREVLDEASLRITTRFKNQPFVAASVEQTLGEVYTRLGVYSPAKKHLRRAYELLRTARGERDRETLSARRNLDTLLFHTGQYEQGIRQMEASLAIMRDALGEDDYVTVCAMAGLGELYAWQNQFDKAEPMLLLAITGLDKAVGPRHRHAMSARNNLAILYSDRRQFDKAEALLRSVYEGMRDEYGEEDPDTLQAHLNIVHVYNQAGRLEEAEEIGRKLLETGRRTLGDEHPTTLNAMNNLAVTYMQKGQPELAEPLYVEGLEASRRILGAEHPDVLTSMTNLGRLYTTMGRLEDSVRILTESVVLTRKVKPPGHFGLGVTLQRLGEALCGLDRFEEAIPPLLEAYDVILPIVGSEHRGITSLIEQLTTAYEKTGNTEAATEWRAKLPKEESNDGK